MLESCHLVLEVKIFCILFPGLFYRNLQRDSFLIWDAQNGHSWWISALPWSGEHFLRLSFASTRGRQRPQISSGLYTRTTFCSAAWIHFNFVGRHPPYRKSSWKHVALSQLGFLCLDSSRASLERVCRVRVQTPKITNTCFWHQNVSSQITGALWKMILIDSILFLRTNGAGWIIGQ